MTLESRTLPVAVKKTPRRAQHVSYRDLHPRGIYSHLYTSGRVSYTDTTESQSIGGCPIVLYFTSFTFAHREPQRKFSRRFANTTPCFFC